MIKHLNSKVLIFFPDWVDAVTFGKHVFFRSDSPAERLVRHEAVHVEQYRELGIVKFLVRYLWYNIKYGYADNPFEIEARKVE